MAEGGSSPGGANGGGRFEANVADDQTDSLDPFAELLAEHNRLLEDKKRSYESGRTPPTAINFALTNIVNQITEKALARREATGDESEGLRSWLREQAAGGSFAAGDALELLADQDPWWGES